MTKYLLGIDPGLSGAITLYRKQPKLEVATIDMPTHEITTNGKKRSQLDLYQLAGFFDMWADQIDKAVIEQPNAMPSVPDKTGKRRSMGAQSAFNFGHACGTVQAMAAAHFIPMRLVRPNRWKAAMGLSSDKDASRLLASQLLPGFAHLWPLKKHDGRAESALLALYGERLL